MSGLIGVREPSGILKLSSFFSLDDEFVSILISSCIDKYPKLSFDFIIQNGEMDFISDDIDCMFQLGHLKDSSIVTRGLGEVDICYYAAPSYLEGRGGLSKNADFSSHRLVHFKPHSCSGIPEDSMLKTSIVCSFQTDDLMTARQMALGGAGITRLPSPHARKLVAENRLVKVLSHETVTLPLHLILGNHRELSKNLRAFVDHLITFSHPTSPWNPL
ncbi:MAG: hypothetical protein KUG73_08520 [Pseudomonadales bacterium]|nr:hypothetical protein [Pseudomonadales bacterium]